MGKGTKNIGLVPSSKSRANRIIMESLQHPAEPATADENHAKIKTLKKEYRYLSLLNQELMKKFVQR